MNVKGTRPLQHDSCVHQQNAATSDSKKMSRRHVHRHDMTCLFFRLYGQNVVFCAAIWAVLLICPSFVRSLPPGDKGGRGESFSLPSSFFSCFLPQLRSAQDLALSPSCSVDRFISDIPTSTPVMIEVSESLLRGGWCSPEKGGERGGDSSLSDRSVWDTVTEIPPDKDSEVQLLSKLLVSQSLKG